MAGVDTSQNKELEIKKCRVKILIKKKKKEKKERKKGKCRVKMGHLTERTDTITG